MHVISGSSAAVPRSEGHLCGPSGNRIGHRPNVHTMSTSITYLWTQYVDSHCSGSGICWNTTTRKLRDRNQHDVMRDISLHECTACIFYHGAPGCSGTSSLASVIDGCSLCDLHDIVSAPQHHNSFLRVVGLTLQRADWHEDRGYGSELGRLEEEARATMEQRRMEQLVATGGSKHDYTKSSHTKPKRTRRGTVDKQQGHMESTAATHHTHATMGRS